MATKTPDKMWRYLKKALEDIAEELGTQDVVTTAVKGTLRGVVEVMSNIENETAEEFEARLATRISENIDEIKH